jgi:Tol biopolymer transport system component
VAAQIADALVAAHEAGIIHRDIKPENVMMRRDRYVKVLDFGLAKLTENIAELRPSQSDAASRPTIKTNPGVVMGTVEYMSPEQARALPVDERTDVWSLGVVLYEMVAGRRPFTGQTPGHTTVAILDQEPLALRRQAPKAPEELERIVTKALAKDVDERYQTVKDMAIDLRQLRRRLDADAEIERSSYPGNSEQTDSAGDVQSAALATEVQAGRLSEGGTAHSTSSVEYVVSEIRRHKRAAGVFGITLVLVLGAAGYVLFRFLNRTASPILPFQSTRMSRLTATGKVMNAAISPDGKYVAYGELSERQESLWVRQVATGSSVQLAPPADVSYGGMTFSNDSNYIYYSKANKGDSSWALYQVATLSGTAKKLINRVDSAVTFSPDGRRLAFLRADPTQGQTSLVGANIDGTGEQILVTRKLPDFFFFEGISRISWSPDGKLIACPGGSTDSNGLYFNVIGVRVADGVTEVLSSRHWAGISQVVWLSDGRSLIMAAMEDEAAPAQLWRISYPSGDVQRITNDLNRYEFVSLNEGSRTLVTVQSNRASNIWIAPNGDATRAKEITSGTSDSSLGLSWTPDGRVVYESDASGRPDIWVMHADGSDRRQLTSDGYNFRPVISPGGSHIVFHSFRSGGTNIWRMDLDGGNLKQLTYGKKNFFPDISPDEQWVVYSSYDSGELTLWKVSIDGGAPTKLNDSTANLPSISPNGKYIASFYWDETASPPIGVMIIPFTGGPPTKRLNILPDAINGFALHWSPDGRAILYFAENLGNIWSQPIDGGKPTQLTNFQGDQIFNFCWSPDGKWLALARGRIKDDAVLISDEK